VTSVTAHVLSFILLGFGPRYHDVMRTASVTGSNVPDAKPPAGEQPKGQNRRRFPRYRTDLPLSVRNNDERDLDGRCFCIAEGGLGAYLPEPMALGSVLQLRLALPTCSTLLSVWAIVRYQLDLHHGFEFVSLTDGERLSLSEFCNELAIQQGGQE
jgi:PilZ domain